MTTANTTTARTSIKTGPSAELGSKLAYLTRALKTPTIARVGTTWPRRPAS